MNISKKHERMFEERMNYQSCIMRIVEYNNYDDIVVEFQDDYRTRVRTSYKHFINGNIKNPYYPSVYGVGIVGNKYFNWVNKKATKEYDAWKQMLRRCYDQKLKEKYPTYKDVTCCKEWLLYENFYEWLHSQPNFNKWLNGDRWEVDKDVLDKRNKIYSPENCYLVPHNVNTLFTKHDAGRGSLPVGITKNSKGFSVRCNNPLTGIREYLGTYKTIKESFGVYKYYKEDIIKQVAQKEYDENNITERCYKAMMNYKVEITD